MARRGWVVTWLITALGLLVGSLSVAVAESAAPPKITVIAEPDANPWSHLRLHNDPKNFQFAIVTDRTGGHRPGVFEDVIRKLNLLQPEFVMSVGDLIKGYTRDEAQLNREWDEFTGLIEQLQMPFFYLPGNHDINNEVMAQVWQERFGRAYYHFVYRDVLFLCLNTEDPMRGSRKGGILEDQYKYVKRVLGEHSEVRWTLVFMHQPLWSQKEPTGYWPEVEALLKNRRHTVFAGHYHRYVKAERNQGTYFVLATTGGWSRLRGPDFGEFDHVVWVTMTDAGPIIANLLLEGIWDQDVVDQEHQMFMEAFRYGAPLRIAPLLVEKPGFEPQPLEMWLTNDKNVPMTATLTFLASETLAVAPKRLDMTVSPNTVELLSLNVSKQGDGPIQDIAPIEVKADVVLDVEGRPLVRVQSTHLIVPEVVHTPVPAQAAPVIDGKLDEWGELPFVVREPAQVTRKEATWTGPDDSRFRFGVQVDEAYVYVGIDVTDDTLITRPSEQTWRQDSVAVRFDARPLSESAVGRGERMFRDFLYIGIGPGQTPSGTNVRFRPTRLPVGLRSASAPTDAGYAVEIAVPTDYIRQKQGEDWQHFRLNVAVDDRDGRDGMARIWWRPDWRTDATYSGSGMFRRP